MWEVEIGRISVPGQPGEDSLRDPSPKQPEQNGLEARLKYESACFAMVKS
jgi:hypothetical protein